MALGSYLVMLHVELCFPNPREGNGRQAEEEEEEAVGNGENDNHVISVAPKGRVANRKRTSRGLLGQRKHTRL